MSNRTKLGVVCFIGLCISVMALAISSGNPTPVPSTFNQVWRAVTEVPKPSDFGPGVDMEEVQEDLEAYGTPDQPVLPQKSGLAKAAWAIASGALRRAAYRTVHSSDDYRDHFEKLVHANGTCFSGVWEIDEESPYTGLFQKGSSALVIGRVSTADFKTIASEPRAFGLAVKLFPTMDPDQPVTTANLFTIHDLNGTNDKHVTDVRFTNEPPVVASPSVALVGFIFSLVDSNPNARPLYPISRAGLAPGLMPTTPKWIRIQLAPGEKNPKADDSDFRAELSPQNYPDGLCYTIEVSDTTKDTFATAGWMKIGRIRTSEMKVSFGCDHRLHFPHPKFKDPMVNPETVQEGTL
jgi:hypothetical protein